MTGTRPEVTPKGHDVSVWASVRQRAERIDLDELATRLAAPPGTPLLVLAAHPDDETLGLGRLVHQWAGHRGPVTAVVATAGEACVDQVTARPPGIAERRLAEWEAATARLGVGDRHALGLPDGGLVGCASVLVESLARVTDRLLTRHGRVVLAAPWRRDPHPDHQSVGLAAATVAAGRGLPLIEYGVWMTYWCTPAELGADQRRLAVLEADPAADSAHTAACAEFVSQLQPLSPGLGAVVPPEMLEHHHDQLVLLPDTQLCTTKAQELDTDDGHSPQPAVPDPRTVDPAARLPTP